MTFIIESVQVEAPSAAELSRGVIKRVDRDVLRIGRGPDADLRLEESTVDLEHALVRSGDDGWEVVDQGSTTGTYLNSKKVSRAVLRDRDWIEIGRYRLAVRIRANEPVRISVQQLDEEYQRFRRAGEEEPLTAAAIDYPDRYGLKRRFVNKTFISLLAAIATATAVGVTALTGGTYLFRPGSVSDAHASIVDDCGACHLAWHGIDDRRCSECHAGPEHQPRQTSEPRCSSCHVEHRFVPRLAATPSAKCVACHGELEVDRGELLFAARVTDFASDHPEFRLPVRIAGVQRRVPFDDPAARSSDPARTDLNHKLHLNAGLKGPRGPVQLDCFSCHQPLESGAIQPVDYERHCESCHALTFDPRYPAAPHESPEQVHAFLLRTYAEVEGERLPVREARRRLPARSSSAPPSLSLDEKVLAEVVKAEYNLYRMACDKCHELELTAVPPRVVSPVPPTKWFAHATFDHHSHRTLECLECHRQALTSERTADVLLPGIETCKPCHGGVDPLIGSARASATGECVSCHLYHAASRSGDWEAASGLER